MTENILNQPFTSQQYAEFAIRANKNGQRIEIIEDTVYALYDCESVNNNEIIDISGTENYINKKRFEAIKNRVIEINSELIELDGKRIRAMCEPEIKNEETGETWLDYYNNQVNQLRIELQELEKENIDVE